MIYHFLYHFDNFLHWGRRIDDWFLPKLDYLFECGWRFLLQLQIYWQKLGGFINYNWQIDGWHRIGMLWIVIHFWLDVGLVIYIIYRMRRKR